jgi:hypothetical protein
MRPSQHLLDWLQFLNSNYKRLHILRFRLRLRSSSNDHALMNHPLNYWPLQCPCRDKRYLRQQFTHKTLSTRHYLQGWSRLGHHARHLRRCPFAIRDSLPTTCPSTTSAKWKPPTWPSPSETTIGISNTKQTPSSTPSRGNKWNARH